MIKNKKKWFRSTFKFSNNDTNKPILPILLLRKHGYHYEYMDEWEKFNEKSLPKKEESYSNLNIEDVTSL